VNDIFTEINEDLRRDRVIEFWNKHRILIIAGAIAILAGTAISVFWQNYSARQIAEEGQAYQQTLTLIQKDGKAGRDSLAHIANGNGHFKRPAQFKLAAEAITANDKEGALNILAQLAQEKSDPASSQLASLQAAYLAIDLKKHDQVEALLMPLMLEGNAYRPLAMEASLINALQKGDKEKAKEIMQALTIIATSPDAPSGLNERIQLLQTEIGS